MIEITRKNVIEIGGHIILLKTIAILLPHALNYKPAASDVLTSIAQAEAEKSAAEQRQKAVEQAEKDALIKRLSQPSGLSEEEKLKLAPTVIKRAINNGLFEVQILEF